jgi:hypothetical protein
MPLRTPWSIVERDEEEDGVESVPTRLRALLVLTGDSLSPKPLDHARFLSIVAPAASRSSTKEVGSLETTFFFLKKVRMGTGLVTSLKFGTNSDNIMSREWVLTSDSP